jgi:hypothetical protein
VIQDVALYDRLMALDRPQGTEDRVLRVGERVLRLEGLNSMLAADVERRWGPFLLREDPTPPFSTLRFLAGGRERWLERSYGESYRVEAVNDLPQRVVVSYNFAIGADASPGSWRAALSDQPDEQPGRVLENVVRYVVARMALKLGGFALHAAGVLREGRAYVFAGPSLSGKTTVVSRSAPAQSLGDDFAVVFPEDEVWHAPALPFDNSECITGTPPLGSYPVAGIWRLVQAERNHVEQLPANLAVASLLACTAFPWAMPEESEALLLHAEDFMARCPFAHLHFTKQVDFWDELA